MTSPTLSFSPALIRLVREWASRSRPASQPNGGL
jgi:hypothetical protein